MAQLWVNLPARDKMNPPRYQAIGNDSIPAVELPGAVGRVRIIAGKFGGTSGPARTWTELNVWDVAMSAGACALDVPEGHNTVLAALGGELSLATGQVLREGDLVILGSAGSRVSLSSRSDASFLLLSGVPIDEPVAGYGPFVMNTREEIVAAFEDLQAGRFGTLG
jgi:quercetin 2,3-dioxygenase